jgi:lipid A 4'-phosphatase
MKKRRWWLSALPHHQASGLLLPAHSSGTKRLLWWVLPNACFLALLFLVSPFDLPIEQFFHRGGSFVNNWLVQFFYYYGFYPAVLVANLGALLVLLALLTERWRTWWRAGMFLFLAFIFGWGLLIHGALKDHWARPRPKHLEQFGGTEEYRAFYQPNWSWSRPKLKSFASGHAGSGFYLIALAFVGRRYRSRAIEGTGWALGIGSGAALGLSRMAQGAHFLTDVLGSAWIMTFSCQLCDWLVFEKMRRLKG